MARTRRLSTVLVAIVVALAGCGQPMPDPGSSDLRAEGVGLRDVPPSGARATPEVVMATVRLGSTMLRAAPRADNVVVSPASLAVALAMLAEGARGASAAELDAALGASGEQRRDAFAALQRALREYEGEPGEATADTLPERPIVHRAARVVVDDGFEVRGEFLEALADGFDAGVGHTDLGDGAAKAMLGEWIRHHTGGLIEESAIEPRDDLRVVLQDALLFAARWATPFPAYATADLPFTLAGGETVDVETMALTGVELGSARASGWEAVRVPYAEALHADLLLPPAGTDPAELTPEVYAELYRALESAAPEGTALGLPTLDLAPDALDLVGTGVLGALGLDILLCPSPSADLSSIGGRPGELCVNQAVQQAVLKADEDGTVAAAVTEFGVGGVSMPVVERTVRFDRPFVFAVSHTETGWPLFFAAVRDPRR